MNGKLIEQRWRWLVAVTLVSFAVAASWFLLTGQAGGDFARRPPWINPDGTVNLSKLPDVVPISDSNGTIVGWTYIERVPPAPSSSDVVVQIPADIQAKLDRKEFPVEWEERPGVTRIFHADGSEGVVTNHDIADPRHRDPGDHPIFPTKAEAEQYAATKR